MYIMWRLTILPTRVKFGTAILNGKTHMMELALRLP
jgi:hypothetical protein